MRKLLLSAILTLPILSQQSSAQKTLFTYGNIPVTDSEFLKVYKKNNVSKSVDYSEKAVKEYIDLYSLFKMKVNEANIQRVDTASSVASELDNYRRQLSKNYLTDEEVNGRLLREAYDRMKEEVRVAHILIMTPGGDTTAASKKIDSIYKAITTKKADFAKLASLYTDDKGTRNNGGEIGFMTALQTVYPFENVMYTTPVGQVSKPFRTQFGYHIVKVLEKRPARGEVKVAQILVMTPKVKGEEGVAAARRKIDTVIAALKAGESFESLVKKYSEDKFTVNNNGELAPFGVGRMVPAFDKAAFALTKKGEISEPVQTDYGIHIIKLLDKYPLKPFDSVKVQLKRKVDNDSRAQQARDIYFNKVKEANKFIEYPDNIKAIADRMNVIPDTGKAAGQFTRETFSGMNNTLFSLGGKNYAQADFIDFAYNTTQGRLMGPKQAVMRELYAMYMGKVLNDFQEHKLLEENAEFRGLMQEYRDGIMLFELMERNVWGKAAKDTAGLKAFYEQKKANYQWEPGFKGAIYVFKNEEALKKGLKAMDKKGATREDIVKAVNSESMPDGVTVQQGHYEFSKFTDVAKDKIVKGKASPAVEKNGKYIVVKADEVFTTPTVKTFEEARGYVISAYQDSLEKQWNDQLKAKYPVTINNEVLSSIVK